MSTDQKQPEMLSIVGGPQVARVMHTSPNNLYYVQLDGEPLPPTETIGGKDHDTKITRTFAEQYADTHLYVVAHRGMVICEINTATDLAPFDVATRIADLLDAREIAESAGTYGIENAGFETMDIAAVENVMKWAEGS